jgi:hypothetical protein
MNRREKIKKMLEEMKNMPHSVEFQNNFMYEIAAYVLDICPEDKKDAPAEVKYVGIQRNPDEEFVTLMVFYDLHRMCHPSSVASTLSTEPDFFEFCGKRVGRKFLIQPMNALNFLAKYGKSRLRKKAQNVLKVIHFNENLRSQRESLKPASIFPNVEKVTPLFFT